MTRGLVALALAGVAASCAPQPVENGDAAAFSVRGRWPDATRISYRIDAARSPIGADAFARAVQRAMAIWSELDRIGFRPAASDEKADVTLSWQRGHHGACIPFGPNADVAHSGPVAPGTFVHFDLGRQWNEAGGEGVSVFHTALHELGHVLGLGHTDVAIAVMGTDPVRPEVLTMHDRAGIWSLYGGGSDGVGDLTIGPTVLRRVAPADRCDFAVFDTDGDEDAEVIVWRTDAAGHGEVMIHHFTSGPLLSHTHGPFLGTVVPGSDVGVVRGDDGARYLVSKATNGRLIARQFDGHGVPGMPKAPTDDEILATATRPTAGDLDGDGNAETVRRRDD